MFFFSSQVSLKAVFILPKNLNTARTPTEMKENLLD